MKNSYESCVKKGILLAAFGSASPVGSMALFAFEEQVRKIFPELPVRWAFTSARMRSRLADCNVKADSVEKALARMGHEKFTHVVVQPLQTIPGIEYTALQEEAAKAADEAGMTIAVGAPLLFGEKDVIRAAQALINHLPPQRTPDEFVVFMGHGTLHPGGMEYAALAAQVERLDPKVIIGTLEGECTIEVVLKKLSSAQAKTVWLLPLLSVIGRHAANDMAGEQPDSWKSQIEAHGMRCTPVLIGTAEYSGLVNIWLDHAKDAMQRVVSQNVP